MFPAQASFIPITVALTRFIEVNGFAGNYPFWYLGTTPVKYLTGPVAPGILIGLHKVLPQFSLFDLSLLIVTGSQLLMALGWGVLAAKLSGRRGIGVAAGMIVCLLPWHWVSGLGMGEVSVVLASALTPWAILAFYRYLTRSLAAIKKRSANLNSDSNLVDPPRSGFRQHQIVGDTRDFFGRWLHHVFDLRQGSVFSIFAFSLLLLTNTTAAIPAVFGILILGAIQKRWKGGLKRGLLVIFWGWVLSLWWYGPGFWWTTFSAPSIGGSPAVVSLFNLFNLLRGFVPVILAVVIVRWGIRPKTEYGKFTFTWLLLFGSLTFFRFMADPDFFADWTSWMTEVEAGIALSTGVLVSQSFVSKKRSANLDLDSNLVNPPRSGCRQHQMVDVNRIFFGRWLHHVFGYFKTAPRYKMFLFLSVIVYFIAGWSLAYLHRDFWLPRTRIDDTVEYKIAKELEGMVKPNEVVFLSGSTVFWLNSFFDVRQVRGGRDEVSVDDRWRGVAWTIGEEARSEESIIRLRELGVDYIVVHTDESRELYHDYKYPEKFEGSPSLLKVYDRERDVIYKVND